MLKCPYLDLCRCLSFVGQAIMIDMRGSQIDINILIFQVSKEAMIRNRYNQAPHLPQDITWESDKNTVKHHIQESQEENMKNIKKYIEKMSVEIPSRYQFDFNNSSRTIWALTRENLSSGGLLITQAQTSLRIRAV